VSCMHSDNGNADRIGSLSWRSDCCIGEQTFREKSLAEHVQKSTSGEEVVVWMVREFLACNGAAPAPVEWSRKNTVTVKENWS
jgi:hypothetical protein